MPKNKAQKIVPIVNVSTIKKTLIVFSIIEFFLVCFIILSFYVTIPLNSSRVIFVPKGNIGDIISYLDKSSYDLNLIDKYIVRMIGYPQSGWIDLKSTKMTKADFLYKLTTSKAAMKTITLIPGETYHFFLKELADKLNLSYDKLYRQYIKHSYKKDGNILAESYNLPLGMSEDHLIFYLVNFTDKKYRQFSQKIFGHYDKKNWYRYITIASIIQKEAANEKEMPIVSSVIYNRLKKQMKLQMDGTLNYGKHSHVKITAAMIKEDNSSYNTYKFDGIPNDPICAVSLDSIKAAIFPAKLNYLYFVKDKRSQKHIFSDTYKNHMRNIRVQSKIKAPKKTINKTQKKLNTEYTTNEKSVFADRPVTKTKVNSIKSLWQSVK